MYHYKEYIPATGETHSYLYHCEVLEPVGRYYYRIRILGAMYKGRPNAIVCVRRHNVSGYSPLTTKSNVILKNQ